MRITFDGPGRVVMICLVCGKDIEQEPGGGGSYGVVHRECVTCGVCGARMLIKASTTTALATVSCDACKWRAESERREAEAEATRRVVSDARELLLSAGGTRAEHEAALETVCDDASSDSW